ncbi:MAG: DUF2190 family protein [Desulfobacteraceae bacterium]|jgi:hypothetical protein
MTEHKGPFTKEAGADVHAHRLVKLSSGKVVHCTAAETDDPIGTSLLHASTGEDTSIDPINRGGTMEMVASEAISEDAEVYQAADGKIQPAPSAPGSYRRVGIALEAATADEDVIEVLPIPSTDAGVLTVT